MPWRLNQASGFRQQGKYNRTSAAERSEIRREAVRPLPLQDTPPYPGLAHPGFHSKSSFVFFPVPSHQPMENHRVIPEEPKRRITFVSAALTILISFSTLPLTPRAPRTVTVKLHWSLLPELFVAAQMTVLVPIGNMLPDGGSDVTCTSPEQGSVTLGAKNSGGQ